MSTRRESHDSNFIGINPPFFCMTANKTNCSLSILHWGNGLVFHDGIIRQTVFQYKSGYTQTIQPFGNLYTFVVNGKPPVSSTRTNDYSSTCCFPTGARYISRLGSVTNRILVQLSSESIACLKLALGIAPGTLPSTGQLSCFDRKEKWLLQKCI